MDNELMTSQFTDPSDRADSSAKKPIVRNKTSQPAEAAKQAYYKELVAEALARYAAETEGTTNHQTQKTCENAKRHVPLRQKEESKLPASTRCEPRSSASFSNGEEENDPSQRRKLIGDDKDMIVQSITDYDVLFGRRSAQRNNPGNIRLRELCLTLYPEYKASSRAQKTSLTWRIVRTIQSEGGRFLKSDDQSVWRTVSNDMAREKVAFTIRDLNLAYSV